MIIGIIGPSKLEDMIKAIGKSEEEVKGIFSRVATILAEKGYGIVLTADKGSSSEFIANKYLEAGGKKVYSIIPLDDKEFGYSWVNTELGDTINCGTWENQPERLVKESNALVCVGYSEGSIIETCYTKWFKRRVHLINELISGKLPRELNELDLNYVSIEELKDKI